jgi:peptidoglycan biosynthesis protein MviN/MurJ (putative lipid II flippase)
MAATVNMGILAIMLRRQIGPLGTGQMIPAAARIFGCAFLMGAVVHGLKVRMAPIAARGTVFEIGSLAACIAAGTCVYAAAAFVCRSRELRTCCQMVYRRKKLP